jgi:PAS domain S-box-containing protein
MRRQKQSVPQPTWQASRDTELKLNLAMEAACLGYWELDSATGRLTLSENLERMFGLGPGTLISEVPEFMKLVHPEDRQQLQSGTQCGGRMFGTDKLEFRIVRPDGAVRWFVSCGQALAHASGDGHRTLRIVLDVTERKHSEDTLQKARGELRRLKESTEAENVYLRQEMAEVQRRGEIVGSSNAICKILKQAEQVACTDPPLAASVRIESKEDAGPIVSLKQVERDHILRVLQRTHWRIEGAQGAAALLDIHPSTLRSRMQKLGIQRFVTIAR